MGCKLINRFWKPFDIIRGQLCLSYTFINQLERKTLRYGIVVKRFRHEGLHTISK